MSTWRPLSSREEMPDTLGSTFDRLTRRLGGPSGSILRTVFGRWEELVGPSVAANVRPVSLRGTTLVVATESPAWATQVSFIGADLVARINDEIGGGVLTAVETRVRPAATRDSRPNKSRE